MARIERDMPNVDLELDNIEDVQDDVIDKLERRVTDREAEVDTLKRSVQGRLTRFVGEFKPEGLDPHIEALPSFAALKRKIENDELPAQEERFKAYMLKEMSTAIIDLKGSLEDKEQQYKDRIEVLNVALKQIPYGERSFIQLHVNPISSTGEIGDFRARLLRAIPNQLDLQVESYAPIHDLLNDLKTKESWMQRVTDPRQWLEFSAQEVRDDGTLGEHYTDTSGKSGGQKAKLAYTVLASAIADQYGIFDTTGQTRSAFRFVAIDEVFSKLDERNAHIAMSLFQTLGLQVLVVTPSDKIHVTEKYIGSIHIVQNPKGDRSHVVNMPIQEYRTRYMNQTDLSTVAADVQR